MKAPSPTGIEVLCGSAVIQERIHRLDAAIESNLRQARKLLREQYEDLEALGRLRTASGLREHHDGKDRP